MYFLKNGKEIENGSSEDSQSVLKKKKKKSI